MNILYLITKSEIGGAQMHVRQLMGRMKEAGHIVTLMSASGGWLEEEAKLLGVDFIPNNYFTNSYNPLQILRAINIVQKTVRNLRPDIVHCHSSAAGFIGRVAIRGVIPTVFTAHSWAFTDGAPYMRKFIAIIAEKVVAQYTDVIICVSEYDRQLALRYHIAPVSKLKMIHNGISTGILSTHTNTRIQVVSIGRLAYPKEYELLLESFTLLPIDVRSNVHLTIVGDGPFRETLQRIIQKNGLEKSVTLLGTKTPLEIQSILHSSDIFILLSKHEGFPMTILEAMSYGLPVIASRVGGIPEAVDNSCGILVTNTHRSVVDALHSLIINRESRATRGRMAYKQAIQELSLKSFLDRTVAIYQDLLRK